MKTLELIQDRRLQIPMSITWYLSDIGHAHGLQELFTRQSPQKLKVLREHAIAQSVISSNRIEGVEIDQARIGTVVFGHPALKDRDEEEVAGYRDALNLIHMQGAGLPVSVETILQLHKLSRGAVWDAGQYLLYTLKQAYGEFEVRVGKTGTPRGEKTSLVEAAIARQVGAFSVSDIRDACPGVGVDLIRKVLGRLKGKRVECLGRGQTARWRCLK